MEVSREQKRWMDDWMVQKRQTEGRKGGGKKGRKEERMSIHQYSKWPRLH